MLNFLRILKRKKEKILFALDIGTESVKALLFQKKSEKISILGSSLEYFDKFGVVNEADASSSPFANARVVNEADASSSPFAKARVFDSRDFETDILKKSILQARYASFPKHLKEKTLKDLTIILNLPANFLKGRVIFQSCQRENPQKTIDEKEEALLQQTVLEQIKKKTCQICNEIYGILPEDVHFINLKILGIEIDGYPVPILRGYNGRNLNFRVLTSFLPQYYLKEIKDICRMMGFKGQKIIHEVEGLAPFFKDNPDAIFLDVGGEVSQIFLTKNGYLESMGEFEAGGKIFSQALSERLGLQSTEARILKERYSKKELSKESLERIKEILYFTSQSWFKSFKIKLKEMITGNLVPSKIILFGGSSTLPEIKEVLRMGNWENFSLIQKQKIEIFNLTNLNIAGGATKSLNTPQYVPILLIASQIGRGAGKPSGFPV